MGSAGLSGGPRLTRMHSDRENERAEGDLRKDRRKEKRLGGVGGREKAGGRWEMPDGGTTTQHE